MKLFITRHGETDWNVQKRVCGHSESQLTELGHIQARSLADRLSAEKDRNDIRHIYVSPLKRARTTAAYIEKALNISAVTDSRIREVFFGDFEGVYWVTAPEFRRIMQNPFIKYPGGESLVQAAQRAYSLIEEVRSRHKDDGNVLFVCHGMISVLMYTYFHNVSQTELLDLRIENCALLEFNMDDV